MESPAPSACPVCGFKGALSPLELYHDPLGGKDYRMHQCPDCEVIFAHPYRHPGAQWYAKFASADSYEGLGKWRFDWFLALGFRPGGLLLDVGCGAGNFLEQALRRGYRVEGVDSNPEAAAGARARGLEVHQESLESFAGRTREGTYDVVTMFDVLEHFDNPAEMVQLARRLLKPEGGLLITTPNGNRPIPFGRDDFDCPPHHLSRWTPQSLEKFVRRGGFEIAAGYHTYLPTWEYSRFAVSKATRRLLALSKRLLYGDAAETATLTQLIESATHGKQERSWRDPIRRAIGSKRTRMGLVQGFEKVLGLVLAPVFLPLKAYYRMTVPQAGVTSCLLAVKAAEDGRVGS